MGDDDIVAGATSMAAQHPAFPRRSLRVAPTDGSSRFNAVRIPLIPVACWRLNAPGFAFDSSFVSPAFHDELATLSGIVGAHQGCPAALFGHCDPVGGDQLNKTLGDRRAIAIYALLTRQPDLWAYLYDNPQVGDTWGTHAIQQMLASVVDGQGSVYYGGGVSGQYGGDTTAAVKRFQGDAGLPANGQAGAATRKALFGAYMDWLCTPGGGTPFRMQAADFLGGAGAATGDLPKMSLQSCSRFNPVVLLTQAEMNGAAGTAKRDADDASNRRVILFLFAKGTTVDAGQWPCPKVKEGFSACTKAFWSDGDKRRQNGAKERLYRETRDTMACRFYDRFARRSPCEGGREVRTVEWVAQVPDWATGAVTLVVLNAGGDTVATYALADGKPLGDGWVSFDISGLDPAAALTMELRSDDVCVLPPVRIGIGTLTAEAASGVSPSNDAYAVAPLVRDPTTATA